MIWPNKTCEHSALGVVWRSREGRCRQCRNARRKAWLKQGSQGAQNTQAAARKLVKKLRADAEYKREEQRKHRASYYLRQYGITLEMAVELLEAQYCQCAICPRPIRLGKEAHLDHCHVTGKIRGWLCSCCNQALGLVQENPTTLNAMLEYLESHK